MTMLANTTETRAAVVQLDEHVRIDHHAQVVLPEGADVHAVIIQRKPFTVCQLIGNTPGFRIR